ncbi:hypothetical protein CEXT_422211, partial [Caerostris extrusa]
MTEKPNQTNRKPEGEALTFRERLTLDSYPLGERLISELRSSSGKGAREENTPEDREICCTSANQTKWTSKSIFNGAFLFAEKGNEEINR